MILVHSGINYYISPELFRYISNKKGKEKFNPFASDVYSVGAILFSWIYGLEAIKELHKAKLDKNLNEYERIMS